MITSVLLLIMSFVVRLMCAPQSSRESEIESVMDYYHDYILTPDDYLRAQEFLKSGNATTPSRDMEWDDDLIANDIIDDDNYRAFLFPDPSLKKSYKNYLWKDATVPYKIEGKFGYGQRLQLCLAIETFVDKTCIRWIPWTIEKDYVRIIDGDQCESSVGRKGGDQVLKLASKCFKDVGILIHEMMHTLGFVHEQNRPDRDQYVEILWDNIEEKNKYNYKICQLCDTMGIQYNPGSIMHYQPHYFAIDTKKPTMDWVGPGFVMLLGNPTNDITLLDVRNIKRAYECNRRGEPKEAVVECADMKDDCDMVKARGDCDTKTYAIAYCRRTCGLCRICEDANKNDCSRWFKGNQCNNKAMLEYMTFFCAKTCNTCITSDKRSKCYDVHPKCLEWADKRYCVNNFPYMSKYCAKTCGTCKYPDEDFDPDYYSDLDADAKIIINCLTDALEVNSCRAMEQLEELPTLDDIIEDQEGFGDLIWSNWITVLWIRGHGYFFTLLAQQSKEIAVTSGAPTK